jgi:hypothetical protein
MVLFDNTTTCSYPSRSHTRSTVAAAMAGETSSIFGDGRLKPGIYKIQNLYSRTYMDIHEHSREVCCRPVTALEEGGGLVCPFQQHMAHVSDD